MNINKLLIPAIAGLIAISFSACSDFPYSNDDGDNNVTTTTISIDVNCTLNSTAMDIDTYITTISGDVIVQNETNTTISFFQDANSVKKVCLVSGKAHIVR